MKLFKEYEWDIRYLKNGIRGLGSAVPKSQFSQPSGSMVRGHVDPHVQNLSSKKDGTVQGLVASGVQGLWYEVYTAFSANHPPSMNKPLSAAQGSETCYQAGRPSNGPLARPRHAWCPARLWHCPKTPNAQTLSIPKVQQQTSKPPNAVSPKFKRH